MVFLQVGELRYEVVDVFAPRAHADNPLAVVFDADGLSTGQCQVLANDFNLFIAGDLHWDEDPATGSAALGTGVWLVATGLLAAEGTSSYVIRQGEQMGRPSVLSCTVTATGGRAVAATVAGAVVPMARGVIRVPS